MKPIRKWGCLLFRQSQLRTVQLQDHDERCPINLVATRCTAITYLRTNILCEGLGLDNSICPQLPESLYVSLRTTEQRFLSLYVGSQRLEPVKGVSQGM